MEELVLGSIAQRISEKKRQRSERDLELIEVEEGIPAVAAAPLELELTLEVDEGIVPHVAAPLEEELTLLAEVDEGNAPHVATPDGNVDAEDEKYYHEL
eukprot:GILK01015899.1.p1 GENE.GILK01015899.1~~GILK01015899.1.p1  ORF type:complete len:106 (-),score=19.62 GILK01015899.1:12-308(-)